MSLADYYIYNFFICKANTMEKETIRDHIAINQPSEYKKSTFVSHLLPRDEGHDA
jgi:hypothetical protein